MNDLITQLITVFLGFFAIMNPIANTAAFAGLAGDLEPAAQRRVAAKALMLTFGIILAFAILGKTIFHLFGITLPALRITGGILVFLVGYHMLTGSGSHLHSSEAEPASDIAVSPLAVPLLAGPGTIATAINFSASGGVTGVVVTVLVFALLCAITYVCFVFSASILRAIGPGGLGIVTRLMGLILAVIGTQMAVAGLTGAFGIPPLPATAPGG